MTDLPALFGDVSTIQLIDWPDPMVPAILVDAGFTVFGHEPNGYHRHEVVDDPSEHVRPFAVFTGRWLVAHATERPDHADLVCTFRPPDEQSEIAGIAIELGARTLWVQPPAEVSDEAKAIAEGAGLAFVHGVGIERIVREFHITAGAR